MKTFLELAGARRSIRKYKADKIDDAALMRILEAGRIAPSGNNSQPWRFIVVTDDAVKRNLYEVAGRQPWIITAPVVVAVVADMRAKLAGEFKGKFEDKDIGADDPQFQAVLVKAVRDATIAADHIVMAATDEGLGTCWIAMYEQKDIRPVLKVPKHCHVVSIITIGFPDESPDKRPRKDISDIASWNEFGRNPIGCTGKR
jgi:nitroreductase